MKSGESWVKISKKNNEEHEDKVAEERVRPSLCDGVAAGLTKASNWAICNGEVSLSQILAGVLKRWKTGWWRARSETRWKHWWKFHRDVLWDTSIAR